MLQLKGLAADLLEEIARIPVVDCHEHLPAEAGRVKQRVDVASLFSHYCKADLEAAGLIQGPEQDEVFDTTKPLLPRWQKLKPYLQAIRFGSYAYPAFAYVRDILGFDDIDDSTVEAISRRLQDDNQPGLYKRIMQDLCGIELAIECFAGDAAKPDQPFFVYLCRERGLGMGSAEPIEQLERGTGRSIHTLAQCVEAMGSYLEEQKRAGCVGMKTNAAYWRSIECPDTTASRAETIFAKLRSGIRSRVSDVEMEELENYLMRREIEFCIEQDLVVAIHTGYQARNRNDIRHARATLLWSLLYSYPRARFDLFHGSFPYVSDMTVLGKYFQNVSLNMCWMHLMGPEVSRRALREWLDAVPVTKIFAFGGDYHVVEKVYGHLQLARADLAVVLAEKVEEGRFSKANALEIARLLFNENPKRWYKLGQG
ncbi:MAG: hypothetical protein NTW86_26035 [Candidatus Sumerlaeota bacterium]|nr:hypothetical protein [Candidatus Sumerlaeota bacterium]